MPSKKVAPKKEKIEKKEEEEEDFSMVIKAMICGIYMIASSTLTLINKTLYSKFKVKNPLNLFMI
jgi:hypothetical protein